MGGFASLHLFKALDAPQTLLVRHRVLFERTDGCFGLPSVAWAPASGRPERAAMENNETLTPTVPKRNDASSRAARIRLGGNTVPEPGSEVDFALARMNRDRCETLLPGVNATCSQLVAVPIS